MHIFKHCPEIKKKKKKNGLLTDATVDDFPWNFAG